ncbi:MAG: helix-turn-helix domain-containing protein, partial [Clostridia bacterium]|nr:helix-turn-helix domain-containing protein [Clostridia bacterium]
MFQVVEGSCVHYIYDKAIPCKAGDIHIVRPNVPHGFFLSEDGQTPIVNQLVFHGNDWFYGEVADVDSPRFCYGIFENHLKTVCARLDGATGAEIERLYNRIETELAEKPSEWREAVRICLTQLLVSVKRYIGTCIKSDSPVITPQWEVVNSAIKIIKEHYSESNLTLKTISEKLYVSESHLSRLFKGVTGENISDYLRDVRIENVCRLLCETDLKVEDIVLSCGMLNLPSFYRNFYERMNMTPRLYRKLNAKELGEDERRTKLLEKISDNLQKGKAKTVTELVQKALDNGVDPEQILNESLIAGMNTVGERFKNNEIYVPE